MAQIQERGSTHVYKVSKIAQEEVDSMVSRCVYEDPPFCSAACPLKLDTRAFLQAAASGDLNKALLLYEKVTPFPLVLSSGCDAPCEKKCRLSEIGDAIAIREVEAAVSRYGQAKKASGVFRMRKKQTVAIFGSGLFTLFLAGELEKKMYPLTVFCEEAGFEGFLKAAAGFLDEEAFRLELSRLKGKEIHFEFGCRLTPEFFAEKRAAFDVVCASEEAALRFFPEAVCDPALMIYEAERLVMGCGGKEGNDGATHADGTLGTGKTGVMAAAFGAKKAALTVDRLAQRLDPRNTRGNEGPSESRLYTDLSSATALERVSKAGAVYTREEAVQEASRCLDCHCEECMKSCAFLAHYKKHPGLIGREIYNNTQIIMGDHQLNKPMNSCSLCGQCTVTCPNGFDMAHICRSARRNMVETDKMPLAPHEFALLDMLFSNGEAFLARPQPRSLPYSIVKEREQADAPTDSSSLVPNGVGADTWTDSGSFAPDGAGLDTLAGTCKYVFFPGCQASAIAPATVRAAYEDLCRRLPGGVGLMLGCCGAIASWAGREELTKQTRAFLSQELSRLGDPIIIAGCPSCKKELSEFWPGLILGIWDVLLEIGLPESEAVPSPDSPMGQQAADLLNGNHSDAPEDETDASSDCLHFHGRSVALHDSCGARGDEKTQNAIRELMAQMGIELVETPYSGDRSPCCGYGGLASYANPEVAKEMTDKCLERSDLPYITYCMACRDRFAREGHESRHILELIYGTDAGSPPDISEKRYNRLTLKNTLLTELWQEAPAMQKRDYPLRFTEEARRLMDSRMILTDDVLEVIDELRKTGDAILDQETGLSIACKRVGNVTFWVKFTVEEDGAYLVHSAYSHRMTVVKREG